MKSVTVDRYFSNPYSEYRYEACGEEFYILEDERAYALAFQIIEAELWAFNPEFIAEHLKHDIVYCDYPPIWMIYALRFGLRKKDFTKVRMQLFTH